DTTAGTFTSNFQYVVARIFFSWGEIKLSTNALLMVSSSAGVNWSYNRVTTSPITPATESRCVSCTSVHPDIPTVTDTANKQKRRQIVFMLDLFGLLWFRFELSLYELNHLLRKIR